MAFIHPKTSPNPDNPTFRKARRILNVSDKDLEARRNLHRTSFLNLLGSFSLHGQYCKQPFTKLYINGNPERCEGLIQLLNFSEESESRFIAIRHHFSPSPINRIFENLYYLRLLIYDYDLALLPLQTTYVNIVPTRTISDMFSPDTRLSFRPKADNRKWWLESIEGRQGSDIQNFFTGLSNDPGFFATFMNGNGFDEYPNFSYEQNVMSWISKLATWSINNEPDLDLIGQVPIQFSYPFF